MILSDFHTHSKFCDGNNTLREMAEQAVKNNMKALGFSVHSYTSIDETYCIKKENVAEYKNEISKLKDEFDGKIKLYCGTEMDYYSDMDISGFDYKIGSVHYIKDGDRYYSIDHCEQGFTEIFDGVFNKDCLSLADVFFKTVSDVVEKTNCDIIGHFDLISKFNENNKFYDEDDPKYQSIVKSAIDKLLKYNVPFEINTGAISRGYRTTPYPASFALKYILEKGGKTVLSSDSHATDTIGFQFDKWEKMVNDMGYSVSEFVVTE